MRKLIALATSLVALGALITAPTATAAPKQQVVEGSIALPAPFVSTTEQLQSCYAGLHRRLSTPTGGSGSPANGVFGYQFPVDKATWNKPFVLEATGGEGTVDFDVYMYLHIPPVEEWQNAPTNAGTPLSVDFTNREEGGEAGIVPKDTKEVIVCLFGGDEYYGYNASFKYTAGKGVKLPK